MLVSDSAIGIMDGAFFVPKGELLLWANNLLDLSLSRVEQCASGAVYCQIIDALFPGRVQMKRVNWAAKLEYEFLPNYKILQRAFDDCNISKHIEVDKLVRAKLQDNLEFLQWLKSFYESKHQGGIYDPRARRFGGDLPAWARKVTPAQPRQAVRKPNDLEILTKERDFYFGKLRDIELLTGKENADASELIAQIQKILSAEE